MRRKKLIERGESGVASRSGVRRRGAVAGGSRLRAVTARAGAESGSNGRRSLGSRSSHKEAVLSRTNSIASTKRQKDSFGALAVCVYLYAGLSALLLSSLSLDFSPCDPLPPSPSSAPRSSRPLLLLLFLLHLFPVLSCFVPAGCILVPLLFLLHRGLTVGKRRGNAAGMPGQPTACIPVQPTTLLSGSVQVPAAYTQAPGSSILSSRQGRTETCPLPVRRPRASQRPARRTPERESKTAGEHALSVVLQCVCCRSVLPLSFSLSPSSFLSQSWSRRVCVCSPLSLLTGERRTYACTYVYTQVRVLVVGFVSFRMRLMSSRARTRCNAPRIWQQERRREDLTVSSKRVRASKRSRDVECRLLSLTEHPGREAV